MRREWEPEDLIASWTLLDGDRPLVGNKRGPTRLAKLAFEVSHVEGILWPSLARCARTASAAYGRIGGGTSQ